MTQPGLILGLHRNRPPGDFVVLVRVTETSYPPTDVERTMRDYRAITDPADGQPSYTHVWFQPVTVPDPEAERRRKEHPGPCNPGA